MKKYIACILIALLLHGSVQLHAQSRKQLENKRKKVQADIEYTRQILKKTSQKKSAALHNLNTVNSIIGQRVQVIGDLKEEISVVDNEIQGKAATYESLQRDFLQEKLKLRKTIIKAYKTRKNANELAFVFASSSFRQALRRLKYLKRLSEYRTFLIGQIDAKKDSVKHGLVVLENGKKEKQVLLSDEEKEKQELEKDKQEKKQLVNSLSGQESTLKKRIRENEVAISKLNSAISSMIAQEIAASRRKAQQAAAKNKPKTPAVARQTGAGKSPPKQPASEPVVTLTPEAREISNSFEANRGSLIWPVERGYISQGFGVHPHPDLAGITIINNGIDITTSDGTDARAVFKGTVSAIINIPGQEKAVLVNHGEYFTVYSRLSQVYVTRGQQISSKQAIGKVWTDSEGKTMLQFQVWKGQVKQNPALWLAGR